MGNKERAIALGMPFGTASGRLRKKVLFKLLVDNGLNSCYRCGKEIETTEELSMEHKDSWYPDPEKFWDLDNIAFSHLRCNIVNDCNKPGPIRHGTRHGYEGRLCRCPNCTRAKRDRERQYRQRKKLRVASSNGRMPG